MKHLNIKIEPLSGILRPGGRKTRSLTAEAGEDKIKGQGKINKKGMNLCVVHICLLTLPV